MEDILSKESHGNWRGSKSVGRRLNRKYPTNHTIPGNFPGLQGTEVTLGMRYV
jgi:hypothetical protein